MHLSIAATRSGSCSYGSTNFARVQRENESYNIPTIGASIDTMNDGQIPTSVDYMGLQQQAVTASIRVPIKLSRGLLMFHHLFNDSDIPAQYSFSVSPSLELQLAARNISDTNIDNEFYAEQLNHWSSSLSGYRLGATLRSFMTKHGAEVFLTVPTVRGALKSVVFRVKSSNNRHDFESFCKAISTYKKLHNGSLVIPRGWAVPPRSPWPKECWNMRFGTKVSATRDGGPYSAVSKGVQVPLRTH